MVWFKNVIYVPSVCGIAKNLLDDGIPKSWVSVVDKQSCTGSKLHCEWGDWTKLKNGSLVVVEPSVRESLLQLDPKCPWESFTPRQDDRHLTQIPEISISDFPLTAIEYFHQLSTAYQTPILYYYCMTEGGDVGVEFAIVIADDLTTHQLVEVDRTQTVSKRGANYTPGNNVLRFGLAEIGIHINDWRFALHERDFASTGKKT